jgi:hypothetical protein
MRNIAFAYITIVILISGPSHVACVKSDIPVCAVQNGPFASGADFDECRKQMIAYKGGMETYSSCVKEAGQSQEELSADDELKTTLAQFNRRARGDSAN